MIESVNILLASPRGFCAGVTRAIDIVNLAIKKFGTPIYVKHEIVHNKFVVDDLRSKGVIFVEDLSTIPEESVIIYSAHGVSNIVELTSKNMKLFAIDATCPLVKKVHREVLAFDKPDHEIILIGHKNHPEMEGTSGRIEKANFVIIETLEDAKLYKPKNESSLALATQTTLSIDDTKQIIAYLTEKFPALKENLKNDICYATQNRQDSVKDLIKANIDILIVVGSQNSSNSNRLKDIGVTNGIPSYLLDSPSDLKSILTNTKAKTLNIGLTAGASAPEVLIERFITEIKQIFPNSSISISEIISKTEDILFHLPKQVRD